MIAPPAFPLDLVAMPNGDVLVLPAVWPVRLTPEQQHQLAEILSTHNRHEGEPES
ncbi:MULTISPECIES: hypothetical protein [unclassified Nonomuraea]